MEIGINKLGHRGRVTDGDIEIEIDIEIELKIWQ